MTATIGLVLDCVDPEALATFWSGALGYTTLGGAGNYVMLVDEEVSRLEALGAQRLEADTRSEHGSQWVIMADPEGNEFCVCSAGAG